VRWSHAQAKPVLQPYHGNIVRGLASPASVRAVPATMPPGASYNQLPYGLMDDFQLVQVK